MKKCLKTCKNIVFVIRRWKIAREYSHFTVSVKLFFIEFIWKLQKNQPIKKFSKTVTQSDADVERQSEKRIMRRQELQELRKLQIEEQRKMAALQHKLGTQTEQLTMKCEREIYVSFFLIPKCEQK